jgi:Gpi18-like mannosyltransferase
MIGRIRSIGWVNKNESFVFIAVAFFIVNQLIEALVIHLFDLRNESLCRWDCGWYSGVMQGGYDRELNTHDSSDAANWAFFPALPLAARLINFLIGTSAETALVITSKVFFLMSIFAFLKFAKAYRPDLDSFVVASVVALNPYSIYGNVGYTESLFLFLSCVFFYLLKHGNVIAAGIAGAFLTSSRVVGVFAIGSYLAALWRERPRGSKAYERALLGLLLIPLGLTLFMTLLYYRSGDALAFSHIQRAWARLPGNPFFNIVAGLGGQPVDEYYAVLSVLALLVPVYFSFKKNFELALFSLGCTLAPLSTALWAMPRYIFWQAPILLAVALLLKKRIAWVVFIAGASATLAYFYLSWLSGKGFLV